MTMPTLLRRPNSSTASSPSLTQQSPIERPPTRAPNITGSTVRPGTVAAGIAYLEGYSEERRRRHDILVADVQSSGEEEEDSPCPVLDMFAESVGPDGLVCLTNFSLAQLSEMWSDIASDVLSRWNVGRGRKCLQTAKDVFFMTFTALKHCGQWDVVAHVFKLKTPAFQKMVLVCLAVMSPLMYELYIEEEENNWSMERQITSGNAFQRHPAARSAVDVTFQQTNMPSSTQVERKAYYSKKHSLHSFKAEVSVLPTGRAIHCTNHYPGSVAGIAIFRRNVEFHQAMLRKRAQNARLPDDGPLLEQYPDDWVLLCDKGYQGLQTIMRAIHPTKKPQGRPLTAAEEGQNRGISSDRVVVENFFGQLCSLLSTCSDKYRWSEEYYDMILRACVTFTNAHARYNPLRESDAEEYSYYTKTLRGAGESALRKHRAIQATFRAKHRLRVAAGVDSLPADSGLDYSCEFY